MQSWNWEQNIRKYRFIPFILWPEQQVWINISYAKNKLDLTQKLSFSKNGRYFKNTILKHSPSQEKYTMLTFHLSMLHSILLPIPTLKSYTRSLSMITLFYTNSNEKIRKEIAKTQHTVFATMKLITSTGVVWEVDVVYIAMQDGIGY